MSNRRIKDIQYDDDEYDDGYSDDEPNTQELSQDDKEQMRLGTIQIRQILGDSDHISDHAIEEALWHYYYDIEKSVTYLKNQHTPRKADTQMKAKQPSRFDQAASSAAQSSGYASVDWFRDVSWTSIPLRFRGAGTIEHTKPALRLRGGSSTGKVSKLAALAAARKQKDAQKSNDAHSASASTAESLLARLGNKRPATEEMAARSAPPEPSATRPATSTTSSLPVRSVKAVDQAEIAPDAVTQRQPRAEPSIFATVMCTSEPHDTSRQYEVCSALTSVFFSDTSSGHSMALAGPSPDDVVASAQAKGFKQQSAKDIKTGKSTTKGSLDVDTTIKGVAGLDVSDSPSTPRSKRKRINVIEAYENDGGKIRASFVVVGHVDHGKSTLMGRLLTDLKVVDQRTIDKYRNEASKIDKSSFALAWVMDSTAEERERGVTVDIATNTFETINRKFTILDAPGHRDFIPNMLAGASQADFAVLVIDASTNSFEAGLRGQTKEHALLVRSTGVQNVVVAINKMDAAQWSEERFEEIKQQMSAFLTTAGFQPGRLSFIPCAGLTGENIVSAPPAAGSWYKDDTLVQALERYEPIRAQISQAFRMSIADVFRGGVTHPLSVSGKIEAGHIQIEDTVCIVPSGESATIKAMELDGSAVEYAVAGQMATLHLGDIDPIHVHVGDVICDRQQPVQCIRRFTAKALAFEHILPIPIEVHRGRLFVAGKVSRIEATLDKANGQVLKKRPKIVQPQSVARITVELDRPVPLEVAQRIVLRAEGATVAAGLIETTSA